MDAIDKTVAMLRHQIEEREKAIDGLLRFRDNVQSHTHTRSGVWTPERRKAAGRRAKAAWRKRKALKAQNRAKVITVAPKKKG